jgi:DNA modification methylase
VIGFEILTGDALTVLRGMASESVHCCVTSPPYWGLRDYGVKGQIGLEKTPEVFVARLVEVFAEVRRVLRKDGTCWVNLGDSYAGNAGGMQGKNGQRATRTFTARIAFHKGGWRLKPKDLVGIPWRVAFALQADGWWLRSEVIWSKPNPIPESVADRPSKAHEQVFMLTKSHRYAYDGDAVRSPLSAKTHSTFGTKRESKGTDALGGVKADNISRDIPIRKPKLAANGELAGAAMRFRLDGGERAVRRRPFRDDAHAARHAVHPGRLPGRRTRARPLRGCGHRRSRGAPQRRSATGAASWGSN